MLLFFVVGDSSGSKAASDDYSVALNTPKKPKAKQERNGCDVTRPEPETESTLQSLTLDVKENVASNSSLFSNMDVASLKTDTGSRNANSQDKLQCSSQNVGSSPEKQPSCPPNESENKSTLPEPKLQADTNSVSRFHKMQECAKDIQKKLQSLGKAALADERIMALKNRFESEKITALKNCLDHHKIVALETLFETELNQTKAVQAGTSSKRSNFGPNLSDEVICIDDDDDDVDTANDVLSSTSSLVNKRTSDFNQLDSPVQEVDNRTDNSTKSPSESPLPRKRKAESECQNFEENSDSKMKTEGSSSCEPDVPPPAKCPKLNDAGGRFVKNNVTTGVNVLLCTSNSPRDITATQRDNSSVEVRSPQIRSSPEVRSPQLRSPPEVRSPQSQPSPEVRSPQLRPSLEVRSPESPPRNTTSDPLLTAILNDTSEVTRSANNKPPHVTLKQMGDDPLLGDKYEKMDGTKRTHDLIKGPRVPTVRETNPILFAELQEDSNVRRYKCNPHTSNGLGGYSAQQKGSQVGSSLRNLEEFVNQNQNAPRWNNTRVTPRRDSSVTDASFPNPHQSHPGANPRLTHELPRPPSPELESISWDEIGKDWLEPCVTACTTAGTHSTAETVNTGNMGREQLPHTTHRTSYQPQIMPYDNNQNMVPGTNPYNNYAGAGTHTEGHNNLPCTLSNQYNMPAPQDNVVNSYSSMRYPEPSVNYGCSNNVNTYGFNYGGLTNRFNSWYGRGASGTCANRLADTYGMTGDHMMGGANRMIGAPPMTNARLTVRDRWKWNIMNRTRMQNLSSGGREIPRYGFF